MRRRVLGDNKILKGTIVENGSYEVGNLVLYDKAQGKKIVIDISSPSQEFPLTAFVPLAVITIPQSHDVYGTGEAGAMSLLAMNYNTPDTGSNVDNTIIYWGCSRNDLSELTNFYTVNKIDNTTGELIGTDGSTYLPSDKLTSFQSIEDPSTNYYSSSYISYPPAPSPYLYDAESDTYSRNPKYYSTEKSTANALSDFNGKQNTATILTYATAQEDWRTSMGHDAVPEETELQDTETSKNLEVSWAVQSGNWTEIAEENALDGKKFKSVSPGGNGSTVIRCTFQGNAGDKIVFSCYSNGESKYDYLTVGEIDTACTRNSSKYSFKSQNGKTVAYTYNIPDSEEHYVEFCYSKDSSGDAAPDCGEIYVAEKVRVVTVPAQAATPPIFNKSDQGYYPAACCCWRFNPEGTEQGEWYLPAAGELGYIMPRWKVIKASIQAVRDAGGEAHAVLLNEDDTYWSSSEHSSYNARYVDTDNGNVSNLSKSFSHYVRGFLRVSGEAAS